MPARDPIRQQLVDARRKQILDAATEVFAEKGFHRATVQDIAETAGISHGAIYNYFDSKHHLLISVMAQLAELQSLDAELMQGLQSDTRAFLADAFRHRLDLIEQNHRIFQATLPEMLVNPELQERFYQEFFQPTITLLQQYLEAEIARGTIEPVDVSLTGRVLHSTFIGLIILRFLQDDKTMAGWDDLPELLTHLVYDGLGCEEPTGDAFEDVCQPGRAPSD
jgi:AcrR family transcriptional regulator